MFVYWFGHYDTKIKRTRVRKIEKELLKQAVAKKPDAYLHELAEPFGRAPQAVFYMLESLNITVKKRPLPIVKSQKKNAASI